MFTPTPPSFEQLAIMRGLNGTSPSHVNSSIVDKEILVKTYSLGPIAIGMSHHKHEPPKLTCGLFIYISPFESILLVHEWHAHRGSYVERLMNLG